MFQMLRLSEFIIVRGIPVALVTEMVVFMTISFLPACIPISLLFSILLTYGRLSSDSEVVAMKASGLHTGHLLVPAIVLATLVGILSAYVSFYAAPWGNRSFEVLYTRLASTKAAGYIQEGTFAEGFFDLVLYADKVDRKNGLLSRVFIYDERESFPLTVIAQEGRLIDSDPKFPGRGVTLKLANGDIHRTSDKAYTKVNFKEYSITLSNTATDAVSEKTPPSFTLDDLNEERRHPSKNSLLHRVMDVEFHKRWALAFACIVFGVLGVGAGTKRGRVELEAGVVARAIS
jgi:lipopolysaccharide export system permease protein